MREFWLILHFIGFSLGFGVGLGSLLIMLGAGRLEPETRARIPALLAPLRWTAHAGLFMLIVSGIGLVWNMWPAILEHPIFLWKMILVVILLLLVIYNTAVQLRAPLPAAPKFMMPMPAILSVLIIVLAVLVFK